MDMISDFPYRPLGSGIDDKALKQMMEDSDRGCALVAASIVEAFLELAIKKFLIPDVDLLASLFRPDAPLGVMKSKMELARAMDIISFEAHKELKVIRNIRNDFAHQINLDSFDEPRIASLCANLKFPERFYGEIRPDLTLHPESEVQIFGEGMSSYLKVPRKRYLAATMWIASELSRPLETLDHLPLV